MKLTPMQYVCENDHKFLAPNLSPYLYGEFLLRSRNGGIRYLDAVADPVFDNVSHLVRQVLSEENIKVPDWLDIFQDIFGEVACDPDVDGTYFKMNLPPPCPTCGTYMMQSWDSANSDPVETDVANVTHGGWDRMTEAEKHYHIRTAVKEYFLNTGNTPYTLRDGL